MPSKKHRINLTVSEDIYNALCDCAEVNCLPLASITLILVVCQLRVLHYLPSVFGEIKNAERGNEE